MDHHLTAARSSSDRQYIGNPVADARSKLQLITPCKWLRPLPVPPSWNVDREVIAKLW